MALHVGVNAVGQIQVRFAADTLEQEGDERGLVVARQIGDYRRELEAMQAGLRYYSPARRLMNESQRVDDLARRAAWALKRRLELEKAHLQGLAQRVESLSPLAVLRRGYAVVTDAGDGKVILSAGQASAGSDLHVRLAEGGLQVRVQRPSVEE